MLQDIFSTYPDKFRFAVDIYIPTPTATAIGRYGSLPIVDTTLASSILTSFNEILDQLTNLYNNVGHKNCARLDGEHDIPGVTSTICP